MSEYGRTKAEGEAILRAECRTVILRFATGYGLSPRLRLDLLIHDFVRRALREPLLRVYQPDARRTFCHVRDLARAVRFALQRMDGMAGEVYNVGDERGNLSKREVCALIRARLPEARFDFEASGEDADRRDHTVSYAKLRGLGFRARLGVEQGIDELVRALQAPGA